MWETIWGVGLPIADAGFLVDDGGSVFYADTVGYFASGPCTAVAFAVGFAAYSEMLPQGAAVAFVLGQLCVAHGNLSCRKGCMLPHTGIFLLEKVVLQMRIRCRLKRRIRQNS